MSLDSSVQAMDQVRIACRSPTPEGVSTGASMSVESGTYAMGVQAAVAKRAADKAKMAAMQEKIARLLQVRAATLQWH